MLKKKYEHDNKSHPILIRMGFSVMFCEKAVFSIRFQAYSLVLTNQSVIRKQIKWDWSFSITFLMDFCHVNNESCATRRRTAENEREIETGRLKHCSDRAALFASRQHKFCKSMNKMFAPG